MKDVRDRRDDDERENGTNGDEHKGSITYCKAEKSFTKTSLHLLVSMDSPVPAHDELDTAE